MGLDLLKGAVRNNLEAGVIEPAMSKVKIIQVNVIEHINGLTNLWQFTNDSLEFPKILRFPVCNWSSDNNSSNWWHDQACQRWESKWWGLGLVFVCEKRWVWCRGLSGIMFVQAKMLILFWLRQSFFQLYGFVFLQLLILLNGIAGNILKRITFIKDLM